MPRTYCRRSLVLTAMLGVTAVFSVMPASARADELVASFAAARLAPDRALTPVAARPVSAASTIQELNCWVAFAPADSGPAPAAARHRVKPKGTRILGQAFRKQVTLSALILMIFNVPAMPAPETTETTTVATGLSGQGLVQSQSEVTSSTTSPPTAPEPAALFLGICGFGLIGAYARYCRAGRLFGERGHQGR